jgi:TolA-binding protein/predicted  nucleic acid-binding Zn-ribbon protein
MRLSTLASTLFGLLFATSAAFAAPDVESRLAAYESEAQSLVSNLPASPNAMAVQSDQRRLVDAQVAYATGDYETASVTLFDLVNKTQGADHDTATFYLGESLFQKGDYSAARGYYQSIKDHAAGSKYYPQALVRLVEIAITESDTAGGEEALTALGNAGAASPGALYARGKWAFSQAKYDDALALFAQIPAGSDYELQAEYYSGATQVAKQDYAKATDTFTHLVGRRPRTNIDRRVIELAQLALGRVYYERDMPSKSIDNYLLVDRRSDLFPAALYEVSWVYVKSKQYDKALTTLVLLDRLEPSSLKSPTVRILEGNLRIRKAQLLRQAEINGTISQEERSTPAAEYEKAQQLFDELHDQFAPGYATLNRMADENVDASGFLDQISGRNERMFSSAAPIPEAAVQWLREEPEVSRVIHVESDLADIQRNLAASEAIVARLEGVIATGDTLLLYPRLSSRRVQLATIQHELIALRIQLHDQAGVASPERKALQQQYAALGNPERAHGERTGQAQEQYEALDGSAREVETSIMASQAIAVALRKYALDVDFPADQKAAMQTAIDEATKEARAIEDELDDVHREIVLGKDLAGVSDEELLRARDLRHQLKVALDNEARAINKPLVGRATVLAQTLESADARIEQLVRQGLQEIHGVLEAEKHDLEDYKAMLAEYEVDARALGSQVLASSFKDVRAKMEDVVIRTDVGGVDVLWSMKEDSDDDLKRLNLARSRDLKQIRDEFKFVLEATTPPPTQKSDLPPASAPGTEGASSSPDKGGADQGRIKPVDNTKTTTQPTVKPENKTTPAPKTGGSK